MAKRKAANGTNRLVIVESPTKARTIERFLGDGYSVVASMGHVRDLPANAKQASALGKHLTYGIDIEHAYTPHYVVSPQNQAKVRALKQALAGATEVFIATDEDREGEAIGWHVVELLKPKVPVKRMAFHEITEAAIQRALEETRELDLHLVEAQETRRVLDRLVGYSISPLLWRKIAQGLSAGRVQSVAVRMVVQRERDRLDFVAGGYWDVVATLHAPRAATGDFAPADAGARDPFAATLTHVDGVRVATGRDFDEHTGRLKRELTVGRDVVLLDEATATALAGGLRDGTWSVAELEHREETRRPAPPFTTSTLQQEAARKLGWSARDTMRVAQGLYERGHITYMRTDSTHLAPEALDAIRTTVRARYGADHLPRSPRTYAATSKNAQEAHEAIRPAGVAMRTADELHLRDRDAALYDLVWKRAVASQMADARLRFASARIEGRPRGDGRVAAFRATGRSTLFAGFQRAYVEGSDDPEAALDAQQQPLPPLAVGDALAAGQVDPLGHETKPPARFTEASLVQALEQNGIGRPSTYASILETIQQRRYVRKVGKQLVPTFTAFATNALLERQFPHLVDERFTAKMEDDLDEIAQGRQRRVPYLDAIYAGPDGIASRVREGLADVDAREISTVAHPKWAPLVVRVGRYGPYVEGDVDGETLKASLPDDTVPADLTRDDLERALRERNTPDEAIGSHRPSGEPMLLKRGPYGPYLQLGDGTDEARPKRVSLPPGVSPEDVDAALAQALLDLPRALGTHPETGEPVEASIGRFGPYVRHERVFASLPKGMDVLTVDLDTALDLLAKKRGRGAPRRTLGEHPDGGGAVTLHDGAYGPYVKHGKVNASLEKGQDPEALTLDQALSLLAARVAAQGGGARGRQARGAAAGRRTARREGGAARRAGGTAKGARKRGAVAGVARAPKATPDDLRPFLDALDPSDRAVVAAIDGIGRPAEALVAVADRLGLAQEDVERALKRARFKLRMAYGKARKADAG